MNLKVVQTLPWSRSIKLARAIEAAYTPFRLRRRRDAGWTRSLLDLETVVRVAGFESCTGL